MDSVGISLYERLGGEDKLTPFAIGEKEVTQWLYCMLYPGRNDPLFP